MMSVITDMLKKLKEKHNISITVYPFFYKGGEVKYAACVMYDSDIYVISITDDVVVIEKYHRENMNGQYLHYSHIDSIEDAMIVGIDFATYLVDNDFNIDLNNYNYEV